MEEVPFCCATRSCKFFTRLSHAILPLVVWNAVCSSPWRFGRGRRTDRKQRPIRGGPGRLSVDQRVSASLRSVDCLDRLTAAFIKPEKLLATWQSSSSSLTKGGGQEAQLQMRLSKLLSRTPGNIEGPKARVGALGVFFSA